MDGWVGGWVDGWMDGFVPSLIHVFSHSLVDGSDGLTFAQWVVRPSPASPLTNLSLRLCITLIAVVSNFWWGAGGWGGGGHFCIIFFQTFFSCSHGKIHLNRFIASSTYVCR